MKYLLSSCESLNIILKSVSLSFSSIVKQDPLVRHTQSSICRYCSQQSAGSSSFRIASAFCKRSQAYSLVNGLILQRVIEGAWIVCSVLYRTVVVTCYDVNCTIELTIKQQQRAHDEIKRSNHIILNTGLRPRTILATASMFKRLTFSVIFP